VTNGASPDATSLALERTRLAHERTLMAWIRTATSLISFGFTIYKFFEFLREKEQIRPSHGILGPRNFAIVMIVTGLVALALASVQHRSDLKRLNIHEPSGALIVAVLVSVLGLLALVVVFFRQ
jgi:putative membrane protein